MMMVQHQRHWHDWKIKGLEEQKEEEEEKELKTANLDWASFGYYRKTRPNINKLLLPIFFIFSLVFCVYLFASHHGLFVPYSSATENHGLVIPYGTLRCDRSNFRYDTCSMRGDIRTSSASKSILLYSNVTTTTQHEKIKPYTRKWETSIMNTIEDLDIIAKPKTGSIDFNHPCQVNHSVSAIVFSTGGYTGNVFHEFNDGILPLYITSQQFNKRVVFVVNEYHKWWITKYNDILSRLSIYPPIDFATDKRTHCFKEMIVGLRIHGDLTVDSSLMKHNKSIRDFRSVLDKAYLPRIRGLVRHEELEAKSSSPPSPSIEEEEEQKGRGVGEIKKPKLVILSRKGSRAIINEGKLVELAEAIGFQVEVLRPDPTTELAKIYRALNSSDAMVGVHGAAMTHFLFMRPGTVFIQIVPLGTDWAAETYYGEPAVKLGLQYFPYKILPKESSLYGDYENDDPVLRDPASVNAKGWEFTKKVYLDRQMVKLSLRRFGKYLVQAYEYSILKKS